MLEFEPSSGVIPTNSSLPIDVIFSPLLTALTNYNVLCNVQHKSEPLRVNVKGEGYILNDAVYIEGDDGSVQELSYEGINQVDFGQVLTSFGVGRCAVEMNTNSRAMQGSSILPIYAVWSGIYRLLGYIMPKHQSPVAVLPDLMLCRSGLSSQQQPIKG